MKFATEINGKALLYAVPLFLAPFVDKLADLLLNDQWPSLPKLCGCALLGTVSASIGLRAFFDGSYERSKPTGNTQFLQKPPTT